MRINAGLENKTLITCLKLPGQSVSSNDIENGYFSNSVSIQPNSAIIKPVDFHDHQGGNCLRNSSFLVLLESSRCAGED